jgi:hypothetical protein
MLLVDIARSKGVSVVRLKRNRASLQKKERAKDDFIVH